jgi:alkylation response protein AidB-like acyl-CoA dehydrogenase
MAELESSRKESRTWLEENCPTEMRRPPQGEEDICWGGRKWKFASDAQRLWLERMAARGWTVPEWPREYGGGGLSREEAKIVREEMRKLGCRSPLESFGIWMLGPALLRYGNEDQKREHLPKIARGEIRWCQGYSEPGSGSDLASLQTRAEDKGDHFLVNGSKIWTSYANQADWIFCLVRTDPKAPKHEGVSFLLFDMASPGVSTTPITLISGNSPFCQTFFEDVLVSKANLVGQLNKGWEVAKLLLAHERDSISGFGLSGGDNRPIRQIAMDSIGLENGILAETNLRLQIAMFEIDAKAFRLTSDRVGDLMKQGKANPAVSSLLKYYGTELNKRRQELIMSAGGLDALEWEGEKSDEGRVARAWLRSKGNSIEGGTSEIQLNIIAKRLLNLPVE